MKYFKLEFSLEKREIGDFPQIQNFKKGYDSTRRESCSHIARYFMGKKPDVDVDFDGLELSNKGRLTDYVSASYLNPLAGLLVSGALSHFLSSLKIADYISYEISIYKKGEIISTNYHWMHFVGSYPEMIDYPASQFYLDHSEARYKKVSIKSSLEYRTEQDRGSYKINASKLVLKKEVANEFDVIRLGIVRNETFVTEDIKEKMIVHGFTGIVFESADFLIVD